MHSLQKDHFELSAAQKKQMTAQFMQLQKENEEQRMQAEVLQTQVGELKDMLSELKNAMQLFPTPAAEPKRLAVMNQGGFLDVAPADGGDDVFPVMQAACEAAGKRWEVLAIVQLVGQVGGRRRAPNRGGPAGGLTHDDRRAPHPKLRGRT